MTAYTKVHEAWEDLPSTNTPINAAALDQIEAGIAEAQDDADSALGSIGDHIADTSAAHAATAVSFSPVGTVGATNVQSAIAEVASDAAALVTDHTGDSSGAHAASAISFAPTGSISSETVQAAIAEVASEIAGATGVVDTVVAGNGIDVDATDPDNPIVAVEAAITTKLDGIEAGADVTDATNVAAAGAVMESDTSTASMSFVIDEDDMVSDSATKVPTQQSVKAYVDANAGGSGEETYQDHGTVGATETVNFATAAVHDLTLDQACTLTLSGAAASGTASWLTIIFRGTQEVTWPGSVSWQNGNAPDIATLTTVSLLTVDGGTTWLGFAADPASATFSGAKVTHNASQPMTNGSFVYLDFNTERSDTDGYHFTSSANLTGTVAKTAASATLTGTGTAFTTELAVGQMISVPGTAAEVRVVTAIASDTSLTVNTAFTNTASGQTGTRVNKGLVARQTGYYDVAGNVETSANPGAGSFIAIRKNGTTYLAANGINNDSVAGYGDINANAVLLSQWDYVELGVRVGATSKNVNSAGDYTPEFSIHYLGS